MNKQSARWPVYLAIFLLAAFTLIFLMEFVVASLGSPATSEAPPLTETTYLDEVEPILVNADPNNGDQLVLAFDCAACHIAGAANGIAPPFEGMSSRAALQRPPLSAEAYIYESIMHPAAFVVEGFPGAMPLNYPDRLSDEQLGDIIAYLLDQ